MKKGRPTKAAFFVFGFYDLVLWLLALALIFVSGLFFNIFIVSLIMKLSLACELNGVNAQLLIEVQPQVLPLSSRAELSEEVMTSFVCEAWDQIQKEVLSQSVCSLQRLIEEIFQKFEYECAKSHCEKLEGELRLRKP